MPNTHRRRRHDATRVVVGKFVQTRGDCYQLVANSVHTVNATQLDSCLASASAVCIGLKAPHRPIVGTQWSDQQVSFHSAVGDCARSLATNYDRFVTRLPATVWRHCSTATVEVPGDQRASVWSSVYDDATTQHDSQQKVFFCCPPVFVFVFLDLQLQSSDGQ